MNVAKIAPKTYPGALTISKAIPKTPTKIQLKGKVAYLNFIFNWKVNSSINKRGTNDT